MTFALSVEVAPAYNVLNSMGVVLHTLSNVGVDNWMLRRGHILPEDDMAQHQLFFTYFGVECLCMVVEAPPVPDFTTYLRLLKTEKPEVLRDRIFQAQLKSVHFRVLRDFPDVHVPDVKTLLADRDVYLEFFVELWQAQAEEKVVVSDIYMLVLQMHSLLNDPLRLQEALVDHLEMLWYEYFQPEWEAVKPGLERVVRTMSSVALDTMPMYDAMQAVTGRNLHGIFEDDRLTAFERIVFVPSKHNGPYISWFGDEKTLWIAYGARLPDADMVDTDHLLNCLNAIGDATRLNILLAIREQGELSTQQIMEMFDLNKSAVSRHLRQLRANELIIEHREPDNKTKVYSLHSDAITEIINNLDRLLGQKEIVY